MSETFAQIAARVNSTVESLTAKDGAWGPAELDPNVSAYILNPPGDRSWLTSQDAVYSLGRYGNWAGAAYGQGHLSPPFDLVRDDPSTPGGLAAYRAALSKFEPGGEFYEKPNNRDDPGHPDPSVFVRDSFDEAARSHDLLYQAANLKSAHGLLEAGLNYQEGLITREQFLATRQALIDGQEREFREADVWWLSISEGVIPTDPYGIVLKNIGDLVFGVEADLFYAQHPTTISANRIIEQVGEAYGSRLGKLIAGDSWFANQLGSTVGGIVGREAAQLFTGGGGTGIGTSLLAILNGSSSLTTILENGLAELGVTAHGISPKTANQLANLLLVEAADALGLEGFEAYAFTQTGQDLTAYLTSELWGKGALSDNEIATLLKDKLQFADIAAYLFDLALEFVANEFIGSIVEKARGLVDIDSEAEAYFAEAVAIIGSFIGNDLLPVLGGIIGETVGYILGSIVFEGLDFIFGGALSDLFDEDPVGVFYVSLDPASGHLVVNHAISDGSWDRNGASNVTLNKLRDASLKMSDAYLAYVNQVIDAVGGQLDLRSFTTNNSAGKVNHAAVGFHDHRFQVMRTTGGDKYHSNDPEKIVAAAVGYELKYLNFIGGDLAVSRALQSWRTDMAATNATSTVADNSLGLLSSDIQIAQDYRLYLDNAETINFLMAQAPESAFTIGWLATLSRAAELGLNLAYTNWQDGAAGTEAADTILSADGADTLFGNGGADLLKSYGGNDTVYGGDGADTILGGGGNDLLIGDRGGDDIDGGYGDDTIYGGDDGDLLKGGLGQDSLFGDLGNDTLHGGDGEDKLFGYSGGDTLFGDAGADQLFGEEGADNLYGQAGGDILNGGAGTDLARYDDAPTGVIAYLASPARNSGDAAGDTYILIEGIVGSAFGDLLVGDGAANILQGQGGGDNLIGGGGADQLIGGDGADNLYGQGGGDILDGGAGTDTARYDDAATGVIASLASPAGNSGDAAGDAYVLVEGIVGSAFGDVLVGDGAANILQGQGGGDNLIGGGGADQLVGGDGNDNLYGQAGGDILDGGAGIDQARYDDATTGVIASLASPAGNSGDAAGDTYILVEGIFGSAFGDLLVGDGGANTLQGQGGDDNLIGGGGADQLVGGDGGDNLYGQAGGDILDGGAGTDMARYDDAATGVIASLTNPAGNSGDAAGDTYVLVEGIAGSAFGDLLVGDGAANILQGQGGGDNLIGGGGADQLIGGDGNDNLYGQAGGDILDGGAGTDTARYDDAATGVIASLASPAGNSGDAAGDTYVLVEGIFGSAFGDLLVGDGGANILQGQGGDDYLVGGGGADVFMFAAGAGRDVIVDFTPASHDVIQIASNANGSGITSYATLRSHLSQVGSSVFIDLGLNAGVEIYNTTVAQLSASDFIFS
jgi:Ca2+-binding RTX toxin-like protein